MQDDDALDRDRVHGTSGEAYDGEEDDWSDEDSSQRVGPVVVAATFLLGAVTSLVLVLTWSAFTGGDGEQGTVPEVGSTRSSESLGSLDSGADDTGGDEATHRSATRLSRCASAARSLDETLGAAGPALDQWAVHVGAMNKLVVGEITLQQATEFWERTRVGAQRGVAGFRQAMTTLQARGLDCPSPGLLGPGAQALPGCARQVQAEVQVLRRAGTSIDTWEHHVHQMDMLRLGEITPEEATQAWLSMWPQGVRDLDAYRSAARLARSVDGCTRVGSAG